MAEEGLQKINQIKLQGKFKVWILQFMLIPKLLWPLQIYEIGMSLVEKMEGKISKHIRKWLGLPPGLTTVGLYSRSAKLKLPLKSLTEEFQVGKVRLQMMLNYSQDPAVRAAEAKLKSGRKWNVSKETGRAEEAAKFKDILGATQTNRQGIGYGSEKRVWWNKATDKEKRQLVINEVRSEAESARYQIAVQQGQQGQWTTWEDALQRSLSWNDMWHLAPLRISFIIRSTYDQLPTGDNLKKWKLATDDKCPLCNGVQTLQHVLSACKVSLASGRYTWRHNQVLEKIVQAIDEAIAAPRQAQAKNTGNMGIFQGASDWTVSADLATKRKYPAVIAEAGVRPDVVVISENSKTAVLVELTVPFETNMDQSHEFKIGKYEDLRDVLQKKGYKTYMFAVEVGARGFAGSSAYDLLKRLGLSGQKRAKFLKQMAEAAERASYWIWLKRSEASFTGISSS